jgi:hypothetical protein
MLKLTELFQRLRMRPVHSSQDEAKIVHTEEMTRDNQQRLQDLILQVEADVIARTISRASE